MTDFAKEDVIKKQHGLMLGEPFMHPPATPSVPMPRLQERIKLKLSPLPRSGCYLDIWLVDQNCR